MIAELWRVIAERLQHRISTPDYLGWFSNAEAVDLVESTITIAVANTFAVNWIREHFVGVLTDVASSTIGHPVTVQLVSREPGGDSSPDADTSHETPASTAAPSEDVVRPPSVINYAAPAAYDSPSAPRASDSTDGFNVMTEDELRTDIGISRSGERPAAQSYESPVASARDAHGQCLLDRYRFDAFVIGEANRLAHAAALSVAEMPGRTFNPLFIHGGTGLGKTHLLHAIGHYVHTTQPKLNVAYTTTERFLNDFIKVIQSGAGNAGRSRFKEYFRGVDVLLMDDVQFLSGKSAAVQEELFYTFNALHESGRQVVLTSDREPSEIAKLEDRLRSRFGWGLIIDIAAPDVDTRVAILRKRAVLEGVSIDDEVLYTIAERVTTNIRELEGALTRVSAYSSLTGVELTPGLVDQVLASYLATQEAQITIDRIQEVICSHFSLSKDELVGKSKSKAIAWPRQIAMYLSRVLLNSPSTHVGERFGGRDHSTVLYAQEKVETTVKEDKEALDLVERLTATIRSGSQSVSHTR